MNAISVGIGRKLDADLRASRREEALAITCYIYEENKKIHTILGVLSELVGPGDGV